MGHHSEPSTVHRHIVLTVSLSSSQASQALTYDELQGLTYLQVKGSGIANTCPVLEGGSSNLKDLKAGDYNISKFCLEPTSFTVKEESQFKGGDTDFVKTKLMTRLTYTLDEVRICQDAACSCMGNVVTHRARVNSIMRTAVLWCCYEILQDPSMQNDIFFLLC